MKYADIVPGYECSFEKVITLEEGRRFAELSGDFNPLHQDEAFARATPFKKNIVHGIFLASFFSALIGTQCPGRNSVYVSQTLQFKVPVFYGDRITVRGTVTGKSDALKLITLRTEILKEGRAAVTGEAKVKVLENE